MTEEPGRQALALLYGEEEIRAAVARIAARIRRDFDGKDLVAVGVLKGALFFFADLVREAAVPCRIDFIRLSSYGSGRKPSTRPRIVSDMQVSVEGRHLLLVEDIVDTGLSLRRLLRHVSSRGPASVSTAALVSKTGRRRAELRLDYVGFEVEEGYLVGYGMDDAERDRHLRGIYRLDR